MVRIGLFARGLLFLGRRHHCPVCGWPLRAFAGPRGSLRTRPNGYCPRCNSKGRHRYLAWLLASHDPISGGPSLHVAPSLAERRMVPGDVTRIDRDASALVDVRADVTSLPFGPAVFSLTVCVHILEHLDDDNAAIRELYRVLRPGGVAVIAVPTHGNSSTDEDPDVVDPQDRRRRWGEPDHRRVYGTDISRRFDRAGFASTVHLSQDLDAATARRVGVRADELVVLAVRQYG